MDDIVDQQVGNITHPGKDEVGIFESVVKALNSSFTDAFNE